MDFKKNDKESIKNTNIDYSNQKIVDVEISKEVRKAFLDYSMSVIVSRALQIGRAHV